MTYNDDSPTSVAAGADFAGPGLEQSEEAKYWRDNYEREPYYRKDRDFVDYGPAYRAGYEGRRRYAGLAFEEAEQMLRNDYERLRGASLLSWDAARAAALAAWTRIERANNASADCDGR